MHEIHAFELQIEKNGYYEDAHSLIIEGLWAKTFQLTFWVFLNLCSKVFDVLHVTQHYCIC